MLQRPNVVLVVVHCLLLSPAFPFHLVPKPGSLIIRIVELGKSIADFASVNEKFEPIHEGWVLVLATSQRRNFRRMIDDENGDAQLPVLAPIVVGEKRFRQILIGHEDTIPSSLAMAQSPPKVRPIDFALALARVATNQLVSRCPLLGRGFFRQSKCFIGRRDVTRS